MKPIDVFHDPELTEMSEKVANAILHSVEGLPVPVIMSAIFSLFYELGTHYDMEPGYEFARMTAKMMGGVDLTHAGSLAVN